MFNTNLLNARDVILILTITVIVLAFSQPLFDRIDGGSDDDTDE